MEVYVGGETIHYSYKTQTDKNNVTRQYCRANVIVSVDPRTGKQIKKEITASSETKLKAKIRALQQVRFLNEGSLLPFQQYMDEWLKRNTGRLKFSTVFSYNYTLGKYVYPYIGAYKMDELNEKNLSNFFDLIIKKHGLAVASRIRIMLSKPLKEACEKYLTYGNPMSYIHIPKSQAAAVIPLTSRESQRLLELCRNDSYGGAIALSYRLGLRISEVIGISVDAIDIPHRNIRIRRQINCIGGKYILQNATKNNMERVLYLDDASIELIERELKLQEHKRIQAGKFWNNQYNCLFTNAVGHFITHTRLRIHFKKIVAEIGRPEFKFHHLRHTAATIIHDETRDINAARTLLGHKRFDSTGIYIHTSKEKMKQAAEAISNYAG